MLNKILLIICLTILNASHAYSEIINSAELVFKINIVKKPTTRPQTVAYVPGEKKYYIAVRIYCKIFKALYKLCNR